MARDKNRRKNKAERRAAAVETAPEPGRLSSKAYARELERLHAELVKLQVWVQHKGLKVCIVFEGRDGAGKGGTIKAITERVILAAPTPDSRWSLGIGVKS